MVLHTQNGSMAWEPLTSLAAQPRTTKPDWPYAAASSFSVCSRVTSCATRHAQPSHRKRLTTPFPSHIDVLDPTEPRRLPIRLPVPSPQPSQRTPHPIPTVPGCQCHGRASMSPRTGGRAAEHLPAAHPVAAGYRRPAAASASAAAAAAGGYGGRRRVRPVVVGWKRSEDHLVEVACGQVGMSRAEWHTQTHTHRAPHRVDLDPSTLLTLHPLSPALALPALASPLSSSSPWRGF